MTRCLPYTAWMQSWIYLLSDTTVGTGANTHTHTHTPTPLTAFLAILDDVSIEPGVSDGLRCLPFNGEAGLIYIVNGDVLGSTGGGWRKVRRFQLNEGRQETERSTFVGLLRSFWNVIDYLFLPLRNIPFIQRLIIEVTCRRRGCGSLWWLLSWSWFHRSSCH